MGKSLQRTKIPWATHVWNVVTGCTPISEGCQNCYARAMARRFYNGPETIPPSQYFKVRLHPERLDQPLHTKAGKDKPHLVFPCSMSDLFHPDVPDTFIADVWRHMAWAPQHVYLLLTKRVERMAELLMHFNPAVLPNVVLMATAENQLRADERIPYLMKLAAMGWKVGVSIEPMLGPVKLRHEWLGWCAGCGLSHGRCAASPALCCPDCRHISLDWVICGGESGPGARKCREEWVQDVYEQCQAAGVPFFVKQTGRRWKSLPPLMDREMGGLDPGLTAYDWEQRREWPR